MRWIRSRSSCCKSYPLPPLIWARYVVHFVFMIALFAPRMGLGLVRTQRPVLQLLRGLLLVASTGFFYFALRYLPLAEAAAISFVAPVLVASLSGPMLGERVTRRQWIAVTLGFLGRADHHSARAAGCSALRLCSHC